LRILLTPILFFVFWTNCAQVNRIPLEFDAIHPRVNSITQDHKNFIYFGTSNGLYYYTGDNLEHSLGIDDLKDIRVTSVIHSDSTIVYVGTRSGLYAYNPYAKNIINTWLDQEEVTLLSQLDDRIYIATKSLKLFYIEQESIKSIDVDLSLSPSLFNITQIKKLGEGEYTLWIDAIDGKSSYQYNTKKRTLTPWKNPLLTTLSNHLDIIKLDRYLEYIKDEDIAYNWSQNISFESGSKAKITSVNFFSPSEIWLGTNDGVFKYEHEFLGIKNIGQGKIRGIAQLKDSTILALGSREILEIKDQKITKKTDWPIGWNKRPYSIFVIEEGLTLIGTDGMGLFQLTPEGEIKSSDEIFEPFKYSEVLDIKSIKDEFWIATQNGLSIVSKQRNLELDLSNRVYDILPYDQGALIGGKTGLYYVCIQNNQILGIKLNQENFKIRALQQYGDMILIATEENGILAYRPQSEEFQQLGVEEGLDKATIYNIVVRDHFLFAGTHNGLLTYDLKTERFQKIYEFDGLSNPEFNSNSDLIDFNGTLYMGTQKGVTIIEKNQFLEKKDAFKIYIDKVSYLDSNGKTKYLESKENQVNFRFPAESHMIKFNLKINDLHHPDSNMLYYKFEGDQSSALIESTDLLFPYIPARDYNLTIRALNYRKQWSENQLNLKISIEEVFYKTWWFFVCIILILCIFFMSLILLIKRHQRIIINTKNAFASDLHDEMGGDLTAIKYKVELLKNHVPDNEVQELDIIGEILQNTQINISDLIWSLKPKDITVGAMFERIEKILEKRLSNGNMKYNFQYFDLDLDQELPAEIKQNLYLIFKEALSNFIKHSTYNTFYIEFKPFKKGIEMTIRQGGKQLEKTSSNSFGSFGITNMNYRAASINGILNFDKTPNWNISLKIPKL